MAEKTKVAAISSLLTLLVAVFPGFVVFGAGYQQVDSNTNDIKDLTKAVNELREISAAQKELNKLLQRYFEEKMQ